MSNEDRLLVAVPNDALDFRIARDEHWYRIPVDKARKWCSPSWPPEWLAFYHTKVFGCDGFSIRYFARVHDIREVPRKDLFPREINDRKADNPYYQLILSPLQIRPLPIPSLRLRRIAFIPTTWQKFWAAEEINDLWHGSPLEDILWAELQRLGITAERQDLVSLKRKNHFLDFAFYCTKGNLNVETDGDLWHSDTRRIAQDNRRDNALEAEGWRLLRFNTLQIREEMADYCIPTIMEIVSDLGGISTS